MDANGQRFWLLADERHWTQATGPTEVEYDTERRHLRLARRQPARPEWSEDEIEALSRLDRVPSSIDAYGTRARWDEDAGVVVAEGAASGAVVIYTPPANSTVTDVAVGHDDILYLAVKGEVVVEP